VKTCYLVVGAACALVVLAALGMTLAGVVFMVLSRVNPFGHIGPLSWWTYWQVYGGGGPIADRLIHSLEIGFALLIVPIVVIVIRGAFKQRSLHGDARFASAGEIFRGQWQWRGMRLVFSPPRLNTNGDGILVGRYRGNYLFFGGAQFVILMAPTRSGKGVSAVVPNLLVFKDSVVCLDIKQENFNLTSKYRQTHGQRVFLWNPFANDLLTHRYNPLGPVRSDSFRVSDINSIAAIFYPGNGKDPFWDRQARNLFKGLALFLCETPELPTTIGEMLRQSAGRGKPLHQHLSDIIKLRKDMNEPLSRDCEDALNQYINAPETTRGNILASFNAPLGDWTNPVVDAATSECDFNVDEVRTSLMSIYVGVTPDALDEAGFLFKVFFSQFIKLNLRQGEFKSRPDIRYRCLMLLDEFISIGYMEIFHKAIGFIASYGLRPLTILQSISQAEDQKPAGYGREGARSLITNHACQIVFAPREQKDAEDYSRMLGNETVTNRSKSQSKNSGGSTSESDAARALLLPQEIKEIGEDRQIIVCENMKPILCDKARYYSDPAFMERIIDLSPTLQAAIVKRALPGEDDLKRAVQAGELRAFVPKLDLAVHARHIEQCYKAYDTKYHRFAEKPKTVADMRTAIRKNVPAALDRLQGQYGLPDEALADATKTLAEVERTAHARIVAASLSADESAQAEEAWGNDCDVDAATSDAGWLEPAM
jgi:type IV secretion system protein VirD4